MICSKVSRYLVQFLLLRNKKRRRRRSELEAKVFFTHFYISYNYKGNLSTYQCRNLLCFCIFFLFCFVLMLLQRWWLYRKTSIYVFFSYIFWHYLFDLNEPIFGMDVHARTNSNLKFNLRVKGERVRARKKIKCKFQWLL